MKTTKSSSTRVVVVGGGYAGVMAALRLAGQSRGAEVDIQLINGAATFNERIRLHQVASGQTLPVYNLRSLLKDSGVDFRQGWVAAIDPYQQTLTVQDDAGEETVAYDYLIYAAGSQVDHAMLPGGAEHALRLTHPTVAEEIQRQFTALNQVGGQVLIIGGGLTGIELVSEVAETYPGLDVTIATRGSFGSALSTQGTAYVRGVFAALGIRLREHWDVARFEPGKAYTLSGEEIPFDVCLWAGAFRVSPLAQQPGLPVDAQGRVLVDASLRTVAFPNIYAVGDAASTPLRMACATALPMGAYAGGHLAAQLSERPLPGAFSFAYLLQCISLGRHRGLVQFVHSDDRPRPRILTGRVAAFVKEFICRYTVWSLQLEKRLPGSYQWPQAPLSLPDVVNHPAEAARTIR